MPFYYNKLMLANVRYSNCSNTTQLSIYHNKTNLKVFFKNC